MLEYVQLRRIEYEKIIAVLFLLFSIVLLALCFSENNQALDGEYYGINKYRNERAFTISGNIRTINSGEVDNFVINPQKWNNRTNGISNAK